MTTTIENTRTKQRQVVELIGLNNGRTVGDALRRKRRWFCHAYSGDRLAESHECKTQREAIEWLRIAALATKILKCHHVDHQLSG